MLASTTMPFLTIIKEVPSHMADSLAMIRSPEIPIRRFKKEKDKSSYAISVFFLSVTIIALIFAILSHFNVIPSSNHVSFYLGDRVVYINEKEDKERAIRPQFEQFLFFDDFQFGISEVNSLMLPAPNLDNDSTDNQEYPLCLYITDLVDLGNEEYKTSLTEAEVAVNSCTAGTAPYYTMIGKTREVSIRHGNGFMDVKEIEISLNRFQLGFGVVSAEFTNIDTKAFSSSVYISIILLFGITYAGYGKLLSRLFNIRGHSFNFHIWQYAHQLLLFGIAFNVSRVINYWPDQHWVATALMMMATILVTIATYRQNIAYFRIERRQAVTYTAVHLSSTFFLSFLTMAPISIILIKFHDVIGFFL